MKRLHYFLLSLPFVFSTLTIHGATPSPATLALENEFIKIVVNNKTTPGRFSLETTLGTPDNPKDDYQDLIYGKPIPWTSYTTISINDTPYIFGVTGKKLQRRTNATFLELPITQQQISNNRILSIAQSDTLKATQILSFYKNPNTNLFDSMLIDYTLTNVSTAPITVGMRLLLDTKLGSNDGAPLRIGSQQIKHERFLKQNELFDYWQAFDHITDTSIIAQGLLKDSHNLLTPPESIHIANWGSLADTPLNAPYKEGRSFIRDGENEKDTALALRYPAVTLNPNESRSIRTVYGLGGLLLSAGELSVGLSAPKRLSHLHRDSFLIMGYLLNKGGYDAHNVTISFTLPPGMTLVNGEQSASFPILSNEDQLQFPIQVRLDNPDIGPLPISFSVNSRTFSPNSVTHTLTIIGKPKLSLTGKKKVSIHASKPYTTAYFELQNNAAVPIKNIKLFAKHNPHITLAEFETNPKLITVLPEKKRIPLSYTFHVNPDIPSTNFVLKAQSIYADPSIISVTIEPTTPTRSILTLFSKRKQKKRLQLSFEFTPTSTEPYTLRYSKKKARYIYSSRSVGTTIKHDEKNQTLLIIPTTNTALLLHFTAKTKDDIHFQLSNQHALLETITIKKEP